MQHFRDKDQGYAWVVMAAAFVGNMINSGFYTGVYFNACHFNYSTFIFHLSSIYILVSVSCKYKCIIMFYSLIGCT